MIADVLSTPEPTNNAYSRAAVLRTFVVIAALTLILRIWYAGSLHQDDGLWFTAAEELLRGKTLYREVFFDKPPGLPLLYAALFRLFGAHILTIRLFTVCYSVAISALLYLFGSRLYDKRTGTVAAVMFAVFSTTYISGDMQSLNTELLMSPFYAAAAFLFIQSCFDRGRSQWFAFIGGALTGIAFQINPKGAFDLILFALLLIVARGWHNEPLIKYAVAGAKLLALAVAGFALASLPFLLYLSATHSLSRYRLYVWDWGVGYAGYYPASRGGEMFVHYGTEYFLINNTLLITLFVVAGVTINRAVQYLRKPGSREAQQPQQDSGSSELRGIFKADVALLIWFAASFTGVAAGGRFFAHYYFQVLPSLCLLGARGGVVIVSGLKARNGLVRAGVLLLLIAGVAYTLVRTHSETVAIAADWMRGRRPEVTREARAVAAIVRDLRDPAAALESGGAEFIREGGPRGRGAVGPGDYLFVWGNWPEVYYLSGLLPASGYLSSQPLTGVPADVWYGPGEYHLILDDSVTAVARTELAGELERTPPKYIVDELGFRDARLSIGRYPELHKVMSDYERYNRGNDIPIYIRKSER